MSGTELRFEHLRGEPRVGPSAPERSPLLLMRADAPFAQPLDDPVRGAEEPRRVRQARAADVGQIEEVLHHLRILQRLVADLVHHTEIDLFLGNELRRDRKRRDGGNQQPT